MTTYHIDIKFDSTEVSGNIDSEGKITLTTPLPKMSLEEAMRMQQTITLAFTFLKNNGATKFEITEVV